MAELPAVPFKYPLSKPADESGKSKKQVITIEWLRWFIDLRDRMNTISGGTP